MAICIVLKVQADDHEENGVQAKKRNNKETEEKRRFKLKNFTTYNFTGKVLDQLKRDLAMLRREEIIKLRYVFRGCSAGADKMLKDMQRVADEILGKDSGQIFAVTRNVEFLNKGVF